MQPKHAVDLFKANKNNHSFQTIGTLSIGCVVSFLAIYNILTLLAESR